MPRNSQARSRVADPPNTIARLRFGAHDRALRQREFAAKGTAGRCR